MPPGTVRYWSWLFAAAESRAPLLGIYSLGAEWQALMDPATESSVAHLKLAWWQEEMQRLAAGSALVCVAVLLGLVGFTAVTLLVGGPFYEHIAERIEDELGVTEGHVDLPWWRLLLTGARDGIMLLLRSLIFTIPLFLAGFLPVVGQSVVPVLVALVTAWFMALEVVAVPFYRRGMGLRDRTAILRPRRGLAVGLGLPAALLCMIPLLAIVVMPVAFAGGVLVALDTLGLPVAGVCRRCEDHVEGGTQPRSGGVPGVKLGARRPRRNVARVPLGGTGHH